MSDTNCIGCGQCVTTCSTGALQPASKIEEMRNAKSLGKTMVAVVAPSTRIGISESMGMPLGSLSEAQLIDSLRKIGFQYVFDNQWAADACTIEDAKEVMAHRGKHAIFTSCCPAWINLAETRYPDVLPLVSTAKSPTSILCSAIKKFWAAEIGKKPEDIFIVSVMPCTAKKFEAAREQLKTNGVRDCDLSITSREAVTLFKDEGITFSVEKEEELKTKVEFDHPFAMSSGAAGIFGRTGGVTESVVRYMTETMGKVSQEKTEIFWELPDKTQNITMRTFSIGAQTFRAVISHGGAAAEELMKIWQSGLLEGVDVVEVMMCPNGCANGGGQPKLMKKVYAIERVKGLNKYDSEHVLRNCVQNSEMKAYLDKHAPTEDDKKRAFHTKYINRFMK